MKSIKKLLIIRLSALGDICMTLPVIDSFCRAYPEVDVTFMTSKQGAAIARSVLHLENLHFYPINKKDYSGISGLNRLYHEMKALGFDAVADLHDVLRTQWLDLRFKLSGKKVKVIVKGRKDKKKLVSHQQLQQLKTGVERYQEVFSALGFNFNVDYQGVDHRLDSTAKLCSIGIAPFAQHKGKIYPIDQMYEVIEKLLEKHPGVHVYLFGGPEDKDILQPWADAHADRITNVAGKQTFAEDLALMSGLKLMISMDSANMHLASLVGTRCLSIWGATHIFAGFLGYSQSTDDVISLDLACRPCSIYGNKPCLFGDFRCLKDIAPDTIVQRILNAL